MSASEQHNTNEKPDQNQGAHQVKQEQTDLKPLTNQGT